MQPKRKWGLSLNHHDLGLVKREWETLGMRKVGVVLALQAFDDGALFEPKVDEDSWLKGEARDWISSDIVRRGVALLFL